MESPSMKSFIALTALSLILPASLLPQKGKITEDQIVAVILKSSGCDEPELKHDPEHVIYIDHLEYFDFTGHGQEEAIVVASTCMTGTAGPDVHAVFTRNVSGEVVEVPFHREEGQPGFSTLKRLPVFGNPNYTLRVEKGLLVASWMDSSDRENPLTIRYKSNGSAFVVDSVQQTGPFKTGYDCAKAAKEIEQAICYSPSVAALDVELSAIYRANLQSLPAARKIALQNEQRAWLAQREKTCTVYKWWVECLTELYTKRIAELRQGKKG
jgi:uncharacterized protein YecT (DUF1311 family)